MDKVMKCRTLTRTETIATEVSTASGSDRVATDHTTEIEKGKTRSLPLTVLTSSLIAYKKVRDPRNRNSAENGEERKELDQISWLGILHRRKQN